MGTVYNTLGSKVVVVEALDRILTGADADLTKYVKDAAEKHFEDVRINTKVVKMVTKGKQIKVTLQKEGEDTYDELYDRVLVSVGRAPNTEDLGLGNTKVQQDNKGFVKVDEKMQTDDPDIFAIGDVVGGNMLAHKAHREGRIAVDAITGTGHTSFVNILVPAVIFTNPELAWVGLTEEEAKKRGIEVEISKFSWGASGRALSFDRPDGMTKLVVEPGTERILGVGVAGVGAGELISEGAFAIEMGATARDLAETIHPHPTLSETIMECAENFYGTATHSMSSRAKK